MSVKTLFNQYHNMWGIIAAIILSVAAIFFIYIFINKIFIIL